MAGKREKGNREMTSEIKIVTNNQPRAVIQAWELTEKEREEFDYLDWSAIEAGNDSAEFFRYKGQLYYMESEGQPQFAPAWHAYLSDSFFSGIVYRFPVIAPASDWREAEMDWESVIVGTYYC